MLGVTDRQTHTHVHTYTIKLPECLIIREKKKHCNKLGKPVSVLKPKLEPSAKLKTQCYQIPKTQHH